MSLFQGISGSPIDYRDFVEYPDYGGQDITNENSMFPQKYKYPPEDPDRFLQYSKFPFGLKKFTPIAREPVAMPQGRVSKDMDDIRNAYNELEVLRKRQQILRAVVKRCNTKNIDMC
ncbi:unnamed protein product [Owenia fusiformis]|uniref:Uncharacterized protein n=1 Tax=Owenia fusiformis TaxID=6347 RepID=A0A8J1TA27_OWEFU|nr:unnamed protein product [Owenia fusiformis]